VIYPSSRFEDANRTGAKPKNLNVSGPFWLSVGTIEPRKNQRMLAEAYRAYCESVADPLPLVFAGGKGWLMEDFAKQVTAQNARGKIIFTGRVSDDELIWLYRNCYANLYPSLFEGFGLPVLEGMQYGAATISSSSSSLPEVAGSSAILIDPLATEAWTTALVTLHGNSDMRSQLKAAALERAKMFDRRTTLKQVTELYEEAVTSPKRAPHG
jgi:glycosyltransferase involved in cell wall biosynthesis